MSGNRGTAAKGENDCFSNSDTEVIVSYAAAETYLSVYSEASDQNRSCLSLSVDQINTIAYTHIHFAFVTIKRNISLSVDGMEDQLSLLFDMTGIKRILSIGGWEFPTDTGTYMIFLDAITLTTRATPVSRIVDFLNDNDLDGVDFDWEYANEPGIPGIPAGSTVRQDSIGDNPGLVLDLERFTIETIGFIVDYIVYMMYDLHGQWDYGNALQIAAASMATASVHMSK
ncbi:glycoside hydrolase superfamily [Aspergillus similis]